MYYYMHVLNIKMSKVLNSFIMEIHKFFFLFTLFFSFFFVWSRPYIEQSTLSFLPLSFCLRGKPRKTRVF